MDSINWHTVLFWLFAAVTCGFAVAVVAASNIVRMAFYLVLSLGASAGLFFLAGADFVGSMQLLIYVGGTLVLLIFGVMLTAQGPFVSMKTGGGDWILAAIVGGALLVMLLNTAFSVPEWRGQRHAAQASETATPIGMGLLGVRVDKLDQENESLLDGMAGYLLPFEVVSVHLLVVLIGAAYLARAKKRASSHTS